MIIEITECDYRGFHIVHVDNEGWKIVLGDEEYLFPHYQAAQSAVDAFYRDVIPAHKGKKIRKRKVVQK